MNRRAKEAIRRGLLYKTSTITVTTLVQSYFDAVCMKKQQTTASKVFRQQVNSAKTAIGHLAERKIKPQFVYMWMSFCIHKAMSGELKTMLPAEGSGSPDQVVEHFKDLNQDLLDPKNTRTWTAFYECLKASLRDLFSDADKKPVSPLALLPAWAPMLLN